VSFVGAGSTLELLDPQHFAGTLSGFDTAGVNDTLLLGSSWILIGFAENGANTQGDLAFTNGSSTASVLLNGDYNATLFHSTTNGSFTSVIYG
jgi:hypothetical protein